MSKYSAKSRLTALVLALLVLTACGYTQTKSTVVDTTAETTPEETTFSYDPELPDRDFGGYEFTFAVRGDGSGSGAWHSTDLIVEALNGDTLNDAYYKRTSYIEEKYNVKFNLMWCGETAVTLTGSAMSKVVSNAILAGDDTIDAILSSPYDTVGYMINDYLVDLNTVEYLNLSKPWWDQNANKNLSFNGKIFFTTGEMTITDNKCAYSVIFSKDLVDMYELDDPYEAVRNGTWTFDRLVSDAKKVVSDLNGDGVMDHNDRYGFVSWQDACFGFIHGMGNTFGKINNDGEPELTFYNEHMVNTWEKIINFTKESTFVGMVPGHSFLTLLGTDATNETTLSTMLENHQLLYAFSTIHSVLKLRSCQADFGILPLPKYDEAQEEYHTTSHGYGTTLLSIPVTVSDPARTGLILEAFAAKSMELVTPAFYDVTLTGKTTRDDDSAEMLEIIYGTKIYDIGYFFQWGNLTNLVMNAYNAQNENLTSLYESAREAAKKDVEDARAIFGTLN